MRYGSAIHQIQDTMRCAKPEIGQGCTTLGWTDRHAGTVVALGPESKSQPGFPTWVEVQQDHAKRIDSNGMSESQAYEFAPNPDAARQRFTLRKEGAYRIKGGDRRVMFGHREEYYDYSF